MKRIHEVISNNISWYQAWHGTRFHALVHWGIVAFATVVSTGLMTLGLFVAPAAIVEAQVTASDIQTVTQRLNAEATSCSTVSSTVSGILGTTPGQDWTPDNPSEWENVAWLTRAYGCGQGSTQVLNRLIAALDYAEPRTPFDSCNWTTDGTGKLSNCWWIDQGINQYLGPAMLYGGGNLPGSVKPRVDADYRRFWDKARTFDIGADAIWAAFNMLYGALYFEDQSRLDNVIILAEASTTSNTGHNGSIQRDWSYFYHWDKINNWYGPGNARDTAKYLKITQGTGLDIAQTAKDGFYQWFKHWNQWILYKGYVDPLAVSKYPYWQNGYNIESGANTLTTLNDPNYSSFQSVFSSITTGSDAPFGSLSYPFDSYLAIRRAGWFAGIKLVSLADPHLEASSFSPFMGAVNILTPQTVDEKLSGSYGDNNATLIQYPHLALGLLTTNAGEEVEMYAANQNYKGSTPPLDQWGWYGVTTLEGNYAMAGESLNWDLSGGNLTMKKAWFVFDDEVISTQTGNTSDPGGAQTWMMSFKTNNPSVQSSTGVQQLSGGSGSVLNFGSPTWLYTNGNGFVFLKGESVKAKVMEPGYGRVYVDHGSTFSSVTAVLPGKSQTFTSGYPSNAVDILQLDSNAHVLKDKTSGVIGAAVYSSVSLPEIGLNKPGYLLMKPGSSLSLFNPHLESQLGLSDPNLGKGFNPKFDVYVTNPTITAYNITLPSSVSKSSTCTGCNVFSLDTTGKVLTVNLRVNRKFEIHIQGGQITEANIGLNDADAGTTTAGGGGGNPTCGDGTCNGSETIQSCPVDCTSLGGGGGGGNAAPLKPTLTLVSGGGGSCTPGGSCSVNTCPGTYICQGNQQMCQDTPGDGCPASAGGAVCGNNQIESGEACDGTAGHNQTCQTRGFTGGTLTCNPSGSANQCQFNTSQCTNTPVSDSTPPAFDSSGGFTAIPLTTTGSTTLSWNVTDDSALDRVEIMRAPYVGTPAVLGTSVRQSWWKRLWDIIVSPLGAAVTGTTCDETSKSGCQWTMIQQVAAPNQSQTSWQGSWIDTTLVVGKWWYGIQAIDKAGNRKTEPTPPGPILVEKTQGSTATPGCTGECAAGTYSANTRYIHEVFPSVVTTKNIPYSQSLDENGNMQTHLMDIYEPSGDASASRPLIIWIHGGGFMEEGTEGNTKDDMTALPIAFAKRGYVTASINYRTRSGGVFGAPGGPLGATALQIRLEAQYDAEAAARWFRCSALATNPSASCFGVSAGTVKNKYKIDQTKIAMGGTSAGGGTSMMAGFNADNDLQNPRVNDNVSTAGYVSTVSAVVDISGQPNEQTFELGEPPIIIFHSLNDPTVPYVLAQNAATVLQSKSMTYEFHTFSGSNHAQALYNANTSFMNTEIADFLHRHAVSVIPL